MKLLLLSLALLGFVSAFPERREVQKREAGEGKCDLVCVGHGCSRPCYDKKREAAEEEGPMCNAGCKVSCYSSCGLGGVCTWHCPKGQENVGKREAESDAAVEKREAGEEAAEQITEPICKCENGACRKCQAQPTGGTLSGSKMVCRQVPNCNGKREVVQKRSAYCVRRCDRSGCYDDCSNHGGKRAAGEEAESGAAVEKREGDTVCSLNEATGISYRCEYVGFRRTNCKEVSSCNGKREVVQKRSGLDTAVEKRGAGEEAGCNTVCSRPPHGHCRTICH